ncbi:MAG: DUF58 domain-containing protein [Balneolaceae bacterium]|nr:DUF58 domain-containing protein [Balneolaceae bacterium]MCH8549623.1 DUF58 domain-containing protein [Balneolaceae bacterium]
MILNSDILTRLAPLEMKARHIVEGFISGLHRSPYHGFSVEFAEHKPYNQGDDFRHIDWKVYGKSERFYVKRYEAETNLRAHVVLDISSSMDFKHFADWSKLQYSIHLAASLMYMLHRQRDACGLILFDDDIREEYRARSSQKHLRHLYSRLEEWLSDASGSRDTLERRSSASARALDNLAERLKKRSLVIVLTDLFENVENHDALLSSLRHLRHEKHEVLLFNVLEHKSERELDFPDGKYLFEDMETGSEMEVVPAQVKEEYRKKVAEYTTRFKIACNEARIDFEEIDTMSAFDLALLAYLNKRKKLG